MGTSHEWHPGSRCLNPQWAVPVPLLPDELFSSWLVRAAIVQGCDPLDLTGEIWPRWRAWIRDIDRRLVQERLVPLLKMTGISAMAFEAATLHSVAEVVAGMPLNGQAAWPWMLALGSRNRKRHGGLQYCPVCVATDAIPYYRLQWRFAWHTMCTTHECMLFDRCPHCRHPVEPNRLIATDEHVALCATCRSDLRDASVINANERALDLQRTTDHAIATRSAQFGDSAIGIRDWFELLRWFAGIQRITASRPSGKLARFVRCLGLDPANISPPETGLAIEFLPTPERAVLLSATWNAITEGPDRLLEAAHEAQLTGASFRQSRRALPACLERIAAELPIATKRERYSRHTLTPKSASPTAVSRKWARLKRRMRVE